METLKHILFRCSKSLKDSQGNAISYQTFKSALEENSFQTNTELNATPKSPRGHAAFFPDAGKQQFELASSSELSFGEKLTDLAAEIKKTETDGNASRKRELLEQVFNLAKTELDNNPNKRPRLGGKDEE